MDRSAGQRRGGVLFPPIEPRAQRMLEVGCGHRLYVEECGNPRGLPVLVLHGGPGGGCSPAMRRYFDPRLFRIVLFDQRGCGRSRPHASVEANTTWHLIADIEEIRRALGVERFLLFGGSWGATLALVYAETHPDRVSGLVLRGVFLMTEAELDWFYRGGAGRFWPELWESFLRPLPAAERADPVAGYHRRLFSGNEAEEARHAAIWAGWENALASIDNDGPAATAAGPYARAFARIENHYFVNRGFLEADGQILRDIGRIAHLPAVIVQGRYDMICPPAGAHALAGAWPGAGLRMVARAGHALSEPGITAELVRATGEMAGRLHAPRP